MFDLAPDDQDVKDLIYERLVDPLRFETDPETGCMIYLGAWTAAGAGRLRVGHRVYCVARVAAWVFFGLELWADESVYRTCESPACFAPAHIGIAPSRGIGRALRRAERRGRRQPLELGPLRAEDFAEVQRLAGKGWSLRALAEHFECRKRNILSVFRKGALRGQKASEPGRPPERAGGSQCEPRPVEVCLGTD